MTTALYVPGTSETDTSKIIMSQQLVAGQTATNTDAIATANANIATNTASISTINTTLAAGLVNSIAGNHGAFTLSTGLTNSTNDIRLALNSATFQGSPSNPTGTTSLTQVMMGLGGTCKITPVYSTRVFLKIQGTMQNSVSGDGTTVQARFGTGTAPSNAAAATGTTIGSAPIGAVSPAAWSLPFDVGGIITGLTPATAYWFDLGLAAIVGGTATVTNLSCSVMEF